MSREDYREMARLNKELGLRSSYFAAKAACSDMLKCERDFFSFKPLAVCFSEAAFRTANPDEGQASESSLE